ncbi:MAG: endonuclease/exonuclease/phosphatase family protein [Tunicatimonas sp.]
MNRLNKFFYYFIVLISFLVIVVSLLSLSYNNTRWWMKAMDFPRVQYLVVAFTCLVIFGLRNRRWTFWPVFLIIGLLATVVIQGRFIFPYTPLTPPKVASLPSAQVDASERVRLMLANVYMYNREADALLDIVQQADPDMLLLMENDQWWIDHVAPLRERYPHHHELPIDNTYGLALYSRYPFKGLITKFFQHDSVPSFHCEVQLPSGRWFSFHGVHPVPPILSEHPDNKGQREKELVKVGALVKERSLPTVVAGDFNDVAWSNTSRLFQVSGELEDTRVGRGLFASFDAKSWIMRWPLDHVYVSDEFRVVSFRRLGYFGSDHFPLYVELALPGVEE